METSKNFATSTMACMGGSLLPFNHSQRVVGCTFNDCANSFYVSSVSFNNIFTLSPNIFIIHII